MKIEIRVQGEVKYWPQVLTEETVQTYVVEGGGE